jgi:hypothetical protein
VTARLKIQHSSVFGDATATADAASKTSARDAAASWRKLRFSWTIPCTRAALHIPACDAAGCVLIAGC